MKNVVITGSNRGIGLALVEHYLKQGFNVIALCRSASDALKSSGANIIEHIDVGDDKTLVQLKQQVAEQLKSDHIDILINNAGVLSRESIGSLDTDAIAQQFNINSIGPLRVTSQLLPLLTSGSKVAMVTSRMGSMADNTSGGYYGYRMSKAALNAAGVSLALDLAPKGVAVALLHPGFVQTDMVGGNGDITPKQSAEGLAAQIEKLTLANSGGFWHSNGETLTW
ncbi:SDR family oxidoreductase [Sessilibacter sp. MAH1]